MPHVGQGRWTMQIHIIKNKKFLEAVTVRGLELQNAEMNSPEQIETENTQTRYKIFKDDIIRLARRIAKEDMPKILQTIERLEKEKKTALNQCSLKGLRAKDLLSLKGP